MAKDETFRQSTDETAEWDKTTVSKSSWRGPDNFPPETYPGPRSAEPEGVRRRRSRDRISTRASYEVDLSARSNYMEGFQWFLSSMLPLTSRSGLCDSGLDRGGVY